MYRNKQRDSTSNMKLILGYILGYILDYILGYILGHDDTIISKQIVQIFAVDATHLSGHYIIGLIRNLNIEAKCLWVLMSSAASNWILIWQVQSSWLCNKRVNKLQWNPSKVNSPIPESPLTEQGVQNLLFHNWITPLNQNFLYI